MSTPDFSSSKPQSGEPFVPTTCDFDVMCSIHLQKSVKEVIAGSFIMQLKGHKRNEQRILFKCMHPLSSISCSIEFFLEDEKDVHVKLFSCSERGLSSNPAVFDIEVTSLLSKEAALVFADHILADIVMQSQICSSAWDYYSSGKITILNHLWHFSYPVKTLEKQKAIAEIMSL